MTAFIAFCMSFVAMKMACLGTDSNDKPDAIKRTSLVEFSLIDKTFLSININ